MNIVRQFFGYDLRLGCEDIGKREMREGNEKGRKGFLCEKRVSEGKGVKRREKGCWKWRDRKGNFEVRERKKPGCEKVKWEKERAC